MVSAGKNNVKVNVRIIRHLSVAAVVACPQTSNRRKRSFDMRKEFFTRTLAPSTSDLPAQSQMECDIIYKEEQNQPQPKLGGSSEIEHIDCSANRIEKSHCKISTETLCEREIV